MAVERIPTGYDGIIIKGDLTKSILFPELVRRALDQIFSKPVGRRLLLDIGTRGPSSDGYKVAIMRPEMHYDTTKVGPFGWVGTNTAIRFNEEKAFGIGCNTKIVWNPNIVDTPDGERPPFIGLAHELVHARRNLLGQAHRDVRAEEAATVGLDFGVDDINENASRKEHEVQWRDRYTISEADVIRHPFEYLADMF